MVVNLQTKGKLNTCLKSYHRGSRQHRSHCRILNLLCTERKYLHGIHIIWISPNWRTTADGEGRRQKFGYICVSHMRTLSGKVCIYYYFNGFSGKFLKYYWKKKVKLFSPSFFKTFRTPFKPQNNTNLFSFSISKRPNFLTKSTLSHL